MEKTNRSAQNQKDINYYAAIRKYLQKQYPKMDKTGVSALCREAVFAPGGYAVEIDGTNAPITAVRENLADFIERDNANKNFIPYSLDAEIADLIEKNNCETSSINEYYRWISATADIVRHTGDGEVTESDASERSEFITMSYDRESEILLCLALYESAGREKNRGKIDMLRFKLARLREMRSIVRNTSGMVNAKSYEEKEKLRLYYDYCANLLSQKADYEPNLNLKLKLNINHSNDEDLEEDFSYLNYLRQIVLYMMRKLEKSSAENQRADNVSEIADTRENDTREQELGYMLSAVRENEGR